MIKPSDKNVKSIVEHELIPLPLTPILNTHTIVSAVGIVSHSKFLSVVVSVNKPSDKSVKVSVEPELTTPVLNPFLLFVSLDTIVSAVGKPSRTGKLRKYIGHPPLTWNPKESDTLVHLVTLVVIIPYIPQGLLSKA